MANSSSDAQDSPRPSLGKDSPVQRESYTHAVAPKSGDGQNAVRKACEAASRKIVYEWYMCCEGVNFSDKADIAFAKEIIECHLAPVVEAALAEGLLRAIKTLGF